MTQTSFPCPACGAPIQPEANKNNMACPFCGVAVNIPVNLRWNETIDPEPVHKTPAFDPFAEAERAVTPEMRAKSLQQTRQIAEIMRKVEPVASTAYRSYAWWTILKPILPGILIAIAACCIFFLLSSGIAVYLLQSR